MSFCRDAIGTHASDSAMEVGAVLHGTSGRIRAEIASDQTILMEHIKIQQMKCGCPQRIKQQLICGWDQRIDQHIQITCGCPQRINKQNTCLEQRIIQQKCRWA